MNDPNHRSVGIKQMAIACLSILLLVHRRNKLWGWGVSSDSNGQVSSPPDAMSRASTRRRFDDARLDADADDNCAARTRRSATATPKDEIKKWSGDHSLSRSSQASSRHDSLDR